MFKEFLSFMLKLQPLPAVAMPVPEKLLSPSEPSNDGPSSKQSRFEPQAAQVINCLVIVVTLVPGIQFLYV